MSPYTRCRKDNRPAAESRIQVAVNSEGKTNEATKRGKEPLKQGQDKPTAKQKEKHEKAQDKSLKADKPKKSKGMNGRNSKPRSTALTCK